MSKGVGVTFTPMERNVVVNALKREIERVRSERGVKGVSVAERAAHVAELDSALRKLLAAGS